MAYGELNGHVTDDVTLPRKVKVVTQIYLTIYLIYFSKTDRDRGWVPMGNDIWRIDWSRYRLRHMT